MSNYDPLEQNQLYDLTPELEEELHDTLDNENYDHFKQLILEIHPADIANFIATSSSERQEVIVSTLGEDFIPEILPSLDQSLQRSLIEMLGTTKTAQLLEALDPSDIIYVIEHLPTETQEEILALFKPENAKSVRDSLSYPDDSVGRLMIKQFVTVMAQWTVGQTLNYLEHNKKLPEEFNDIFVLDYQHRPLGKIKLSQLLRTPRKQTLVDIMDSDLKKIGADVDKNELSYLFTQYELSVVAVVNISGRLVGVVTLDDVVGVIEEYVEEDYLSLAGVTNVDAQLPFWKSALDRLPWLIVNLVVAFVNSSVIRLFEDQIEKAVVLAALMPVITSLGSSVGTQTVTIIVRALSNRRITSTNARRVIGKEVGSSSLTSVILSLICSGVIITFFAGPKMAIIFSAALTINIISAGLFGALTPIVLARFKFDPAIASSVFLTMLTDVVGFFAFLWLASLML